MKAGRIEADLNVTPLVDVALVLLILFMATAPTTRLGYELHVPPRDGGVPRTSELPVVSVAADGSVSLDRVPVGLAGLDRLLSTRAGGPSSMVFFRACDEVGYEHTIQVLDRIRRSGAAIGLVTTEWRDL